MYNSCKGDLAMPLKKMEKETIVRAAKKYGVKRIWLFGSMLEPNPKSEPNDIDLAVDGVPGGKFFDFYAELGWLLPRPVDLIKITGDDDYMITSIIRRTGKIIYEQQERSGRTGNRKRHTSGKAAHR
jgi:predicted nucleotidyltransferase